MQYQHLVFEEFARTVQPQVDISSARARATTPQSIRRSSPSSRTSVYRFGHRCSTETIDRYDPNFNVVEHGSAQTDSGIRSA